MLSCMQVILGIWCSQEFTIAILVTIYLQHLERKLPPKVEGRHFALQRWLGYVWRLHPLLRWPLVLLLIPFVVIFLECTSLLQPLWFLHMPWLSW